MTQQPTMHPYRSQGRSVLGLLRTTLIVLPLLYLALFFLYPLVAIGRLGLTLSSLREVLGDSYYLGVIGFSFWQALLSTLLTLIVGLPGAYVFAHYRFPGRAFIRALATVPFVLPTVVVAAGFMALLGPRGILTEALHSLGLPAPQILNTLSIVLLAHVFYNYSVILRIVGGLWATLDPGLDQAAAMLGAGKLRIFREITLPLLLPAIGAAAMLVFIFTFSSFGVILLLGGPRLSTVEVEIYRQTTQALRIDRAAVLALVQMLVTLMASWLYTRLLERSRGRLDLRARADTLRPVRSWPARIFVLLNMGVLLLLLLPLPALAWRSFTLPATIQATPAFTLNYYAMLNNNPRGSLFFVPPVQALFNSLGFAALATLFALVIGLPAAYAQRSQSLELKRSPLITRHSSAQTTQSSKLRTLLDALFTLPLGVSAVMIGLGYIVALGPLGLLRSALLIPIAHTLLAFPFVVRSLIPALHGLNPRLHEAARMLGARSARIVWSIDLPLLAPALLSGAVFAFTSSLGEFGAALLLARPEYPTVPIVIGRLLGQPGAANYGQALALGTILMTASVISFMALERMRPAGVEEL